MQDVITMPSSFIALLLQFHTKASYLITLSCFMNKLKLSKHYFKANLDGRPIVHYGSLVDLTWLIMVGTTSCANFSNSPKVKLVRELNKPSVARMVTRMSCTLTLRLTNCPLFSFNLADVKIFSSVDTSDCRLRCNPIICYNFLKQLFIAIEGVWVNIW